ncbi:hypothetical protein GCM10025875_15730 [Litorihabitans aurantiacus]|uniref:Uncharacterized protein n=2 Tax=Litorihabitans aurantiacus TaxID=1930061 RepID=A0AA37XE96_9MICO|nr:hypothetical protein GCM10025875_15730 [Litorihabitans aurantiacus]
MLATLLIQELSTEMTREALKEEVAWQGWVGALLGAAGSFAAAMFVLFRQRGIDDARFEKQRLDFSRQIAAGRETARQERVHAAWAKVVSAARHLRDLDVVDQEAMSASSQMFEAWELWCLHLRRENDRFANDVSDLLADLMQAFLENPTDREKLGKITAEISAFGVAWHRDDGGRESAEAMISVKAAAARSRKADK